MGSYTELFSQHLNKADYLGWFWNLSEPQSIPQNHHHGWLQVGADPTQEEYMDLEDGFTGWWEANMSTVGVRRWSTTCRCYRILVRSLTSALPGAEASNWDSLDYTRCHWSAVAASSADLASIRQMLLPIRMKPR